MKRPIRRMGIALAALFFVGFGAESPRAQSGTIYVGGALTTSSWRPQDVTAGSPSTTYINSSTDPMIPGLSGETGWLFGRSSALGVEVAAPLHRHTIVNRFYYFFPSIRQASYRERTVFGLIRTQAVARERFRVDLVGGGGPVFGDSVDRVSRGQFGSSVYGPFGPESTESHVMFGLVGGADLVLSATRRVDVVPQFRLQWTTRGDLKGSASFAPLGLDRFVYRFGIGVRARF